MFENTPSTRTSRRRIMKSLAGVPLVNLGNWSKDEHTDPPISNIMGVDQHDRNHMYVRGPGSHLTKLSQITSVDFPSNPVVDSHNANIYYSPHGPKQRKSLSVLEYVTLPEARCEAYEDVIFELIWDAWTDWIEYNDWNLSMGSIGEFEYKIGRGENQSEVHVEKQYIHQLPEGILKWEIGPEPEDYPGEWFNVVEHKLWLNHNIIQ